VRDIVEGRRGCEILYLPPYSADLNPPSSKSSRRSRGFIRKAGARTREALIGAMGRALEAVTAQDAWGFSATAVSVQWVNCYDKCSRRTRKPRIFEGRSS
jgi:hypothetical protein